MISVADHAPRVHLKNEAGRVAGRGPALFVLAPLLVLALAACSGGEKTGEGTVRELRGSTMGTTWSVKVPASEISEVDLASFGREIETELVAFSQVFSTWIDDSTISRFNRSEVGVPFAIPRGFLFCLQTAFAIRQESLGAFDPTVGPIVDLWGFGPQGRPKRIPSAEEIAKAKSLTGPSALRLEERPGAAEAVLQKEVAGARLELSAIAKGRGVDLILGLAESRELASIFIEIGGEIRARGEKGPNRPWRVAVERPSRGRQVAQTMVLRNRAIATSGDYRNYFEEKGQRYSHTIDPRTGMPIKHNLAQVSVVAATCEIADAWATALNVLGPEKGYDLALKRGLAALFLLREGEEFVARATPAFEKLSADD
jgi:FAD:protein FMN transferase